MAKARRGTVVMATAVIAVPAVVLTLMLGVAAFGSVGACGSEASGPVTESSIPAGYGRDQLVNAAAVLTAGRAAGLSVRDQTIGVMTAMGESSLRNIGYGDAETSGTRNPDGSLTTSVGLFQQQDGWGSRADRLDPAVASRKFFAAMVEAVPQPQRDQLAPTLVAHRTQVNADPYHYEKFWSPAVQVVEALTGSSTGLASGFAADCGGGAVAGAVALSGWSSPADGPLSSTFGPRKPVLTPNGWSSSYHRGIDLAPGCGKPIWAANAGTVTFTGFDRGGNGTITLDHGSGIRTQYLHMFASGIHVRTGEHVIAGQQIGAVGNSGQSHGCHLHFEVLVDGDRVDPVPFMASAGIRLGN